MILLTVMVFKTGGAIARTGISSCFCPFKNNILISRFCIMLIVEHVSTSNIIII